MNRETFNPNSAVKPKISGARRNPEAATASDCEVAKSFCTLAHRCYEALHSVPALLIDVSSEAEIHRLCCARIASRAFCRSQLRNPGLRAANAFATVHLRWAKWLSPVTRGGNYGFQDQSPASQNTGSTQDSGLVCEICRGQDRLRAQSSKWENDLSPQLARRGAERHGVLGRTEVGAVLRSRTRRHRYRQLRR